MTATESPEPRQDREPTADAEYDDGVADAVRSLPASMIRSYGISDAAFIGPSAIGPGSRSVGTMLNVHTGQAKQRVVNQPLDGAVVLERVLTYTATATPDRLAERLARRPVAYLSGPPGSGRTTAALVGLTRTYATDKITQLRLAGDEPLHAYFTELDLLRSGYGHIVELGPTVDPDSSELDQLCTLAGNAHAAVVLVGAADEGTRRLVQYHVEHERPNPQAVFLVWLERGLHDRGACVDACPTCEGDCVRRYVERCRIEYAPHLSTNTMADAVRFAADFAELVPVDAAAIDLLADRAVLRAKAVELLDAAPTSDREGRDGYRARHLAQHRRAARLAFAVFDGYPLTRFFEATDTLIQRLDDAAGRPGTDRTVFAHNLDHLLAGIQLESSAGVQSTPGAARIARLRQPGLVRGLLDVAWHEYDTARAPLLRWLDDLVEADDARPVAAAAGLLCEYDFEQIRRDLLEGWAASGTRSRREAAALACELAVHHPDLAPRVLRCVAAWAEVPGYRRDTAVRTYATNTFMRRYPGDALTVLEHAARDDMQRTSNAIPAGVQGTYEMHGVTVVHRLIAWSDSPIANLRTMASRCLVRLATVNDGASPTLLRNSIGGLSVADHARLWPNALLHPATGRQAWGAFERWISLAADDPDLTAALCDLLRLVLRHGPVNTRARFYLRYFWWRSMPDNPILDTIADMLEVHRCEH